MFHFYQIKNANILYINIDHEVGGFSGPLLPFSMKTVSIFMYGMMDSNLFCNFYLMRSLLKFSFSFTLDQTAKLNFSLTAASPIILFFISDLLRSLGDQIELLNPVVV